LKRLKEPTVGQDEALRKLRAYWYEVAIRYSLSNAWLPEPAVSIQSTL